MLLLNFIYATITTSFMYLGAMLYGIQFDVGLTCLVFTGSFLANTIYDLLEYYLHRKFNPEDSDFYRL